MVSFSPYQNPLPPHQLQASLVSPSLRLPKKALGRTKMTLPSNDSGPSNYLNLTEEWDKGLATWSEEDRVGAQVDVRVINGTTQMTTAAWADLKVRAERNSDSLRAVCKRAGLDEREYGMILHRVSRYNTARLPSNDGNQPQLPDPAEEAAERERERQAAACEAQRHGAKDKQSS